MARMLHDTGIMRYEAHQLVPMTRPTECSSLAEFTASWPGTKLSWDPVTNGTRNICLHRMRRETQLHSKLKMSLTLWFNEQGAADLADSLSVLTWIQSSRIQKRLCGQPGQKLQDFHRRSKKLIKGISSIGVSKNPVSSVNDSRVVIVAVQFPASSSCHVGIGSLTLGWKMLKTLSTFMFPSKTPRSSKCSECLKCSRGVDQLSQYSGLIALRCDSCMHGQPTELVMDGVKKACTVTQVFCYKCGHSFHL